MSDSNTPDGERVLKEMVKQAEHIQQGEWPAGMDLSKLRRACSPGKIKTIAAYVSTLKSERDAAQARVKVLEDNLEGLLSEVDFLIGDSQGVYGLHLNGDLAPWNEIEDWLPSRGTARKALKENGQ